MDSKSVLVVEPDAAQRRLAEIMLRQLGYRPNVCAAADEAKRVAQGDGLEAKCLFTSMRLGTTNGSELAIELRSAHPNMAVIFTSNSSMEDAAREYAVELNSTYFLRKPYTIEQLSSVLQFLD